MVRNDVGRPALHHFPRMLGGKDPSARAFKARVVTFLVSTTVRFYPNCSTLSAEDIRVVRHQKTASILDSTASSLRGSTSSNASSSGVSLLGQNFTL